MTVDTGISTGTQRVTLRTRAGEVAATAYSTRRTWRGSQVLVLSEGRFTWMSSSRVASGVLPEQRSPETL